MMPSPREEIDANLARADQSLRAASELLAGGYSDFAASRAYYAAFYAASAAVLAEGLNFTRHSAVIAAIHQRFVKTGKLPPERGRERNWLFGLRSLGDYGVTRHVPQEEARRAIEAAREFVAAVMLMLRKSLQ